MARSISLLGLTLAFVPALARDDARDAKIIATATETSRNALIGPFDIKREGVVVRNAEELVALTSKAKSVKDEKVQKEMETELAKLLKVETIDWQKQIVIGFIGEKLESLKIDGKTLQATYIPFNEPSARLIPPTPKILVLTERFAGEVKFVPKK